MPVGRSSVGLARWLTLIVLVAIGPASLASAGAASTLQSRALPAIAGLRASGVGSSVVANVLSALDTPHPSRIYARAWIGPHRTALQLIVSLPPGVSADGLVRVTATAMTRHRAIAGFSPAPGARLWRHGRIARSSADVIEESNGRVATLLVLMPSGAFDDRELTLLAGRARRRLAPPASPGKSGSSHELVAVLATFGAMAIAAALAVLRRWRSRPPRDAVVATRP